MAMRIFSMAPVWVRTLTFETDLDLVGGKNANRRAHLSMKPSVFGT